MVASAARVAANLANSQKSTGPRTALGKRRSSQNSLKHGFCSTVVVHPDDASKLPGEADSLAPSPADPGFDAWLRGQVALATVKVERCQAMERAVRSRVILRASTTWDDDRRAEVIRLASKLASRPEEIAARLRETFHGCDWLITRWALLAHAADSRIGWTPEQSRLAFDLMGTPPEFREGHPPGISLDSHGKIVGAPPGPAAVARRAIDELIERRELLRPIEEAAQERAEADLSDDDPELRRLRRYEAELHRRMKWALGLLSQDGEPGDSASTSTTEDESSPPTEPIPPRQPSSSTPTPQPSRAERRLEKAESRREAKKRKLDRLLA